MFLLLRNAPQFAPNGSILYAASRAQPFYLVTQQGQVSQLPIYSGYVTGTPRRAIGGNGLFVFESSQPTASFTPVAQDTYVVNLDGSGLRNLTQFSTDALYSQNAVISADGSTVAFESNLAAPNNPAQIFVVKADGTGLRQLTSAADGAANPSLSADGSLVAFQQDGQILTMSTSGSAAAAVVSFQDSTAQDAFMSDDASHLVYTIGPAGARGAVYESAVAGGTPSAIYAPLSINPGGVEGIAYWEPASAGSLFSIYGLNLSGDRTSVADSFPIPSSLNNVSLLVNGQPVPVFAVTPWQINAQLPQNTQPGNATFQVIANGASSNTIAMQVQATAPAVFGYTEPAAQSGTAYFQAAAYHPGTGTPADMTHPAAPGEILETYGSGLGMTNPTVAAGQPSPLSPLAWAVATPQVTIGSVPAVVTFAGLVPGLAGVYQVNVTVPQGLASGQQDLNWTDDNRGASIWVQ